MGEFWDNCQNRQPNAGSLIVPPKWLVTPTSEQSSILPFDGVVQNHPKVEVYGIAAVGFPYSVEHNLLMLTERCIYRILQNNTEYTYIYICI